MSKNKESIISEKSDYRSAIIKRHYYNINKLPIITQRNNFSKLPAIKREMGLNIFRGLRLSETQHSVIIGDLLNPKGSHGQGRMFLDVFLSLFSIPSENNDNWFVTVESERFDIRIHNKQKSKVIIIENKSNWAEDQPNQLYRYWYNGIYLAQSNFEKYGISCFKKIIYLSPNNYKSPDEQSLTRPPYFNNTLPEKVPFSVDMAYFNKEIKEWLKQCLAKISANHEIYYYIQQYMKFWSY